MMYVSLHRGSSLEQASEGRPRPGRPRPGRPIFFQKWDVLGRPRPVRIQFLDVPVRAVRVFFKLDRPRPGRPRTSPSNYFYSEHII